MRICIIAPLSLSYMPYLLNYTEILDQLGLTYELYYWNRHRERRSDKLRYNEFTHYAPGRTYESWIGYIRYRHYLKGIIEPQRYDLIIVLSMQIAVLIADMLHNHPYILDIRDYSYEKYWLFRNIEKRLLRNSRLNIISSDGFREWLPDDIEYVLSHNIMVDAVRSSREPSFDRQTKMILYIGAIGYFRPTVEVIEALSNHQEISFSIVGQGLCERKIEKYCRRKAITNVQFSGKYAPEEKKRYLQKTNFIMAAYGNDSAKVSTAIPNKLYDACLYGKPIIVSKGTYLASLVERYGLGIVFDPQNAAAIVRDLDRYYDRLYYEKYLDNSQRFLENVKADTSLFHQRLVNCLNIHRSSNRPSS